MSHSSAKSQGGFIRRGFERFVANQERRARAEVAPYLLKLNDAALGDLGHDRATVKSWVAEKL